MNKSNQHLDEQERWRQDQEGMRNSRDESMGGIRAADEIKAFYERLSGIGRQQGIRRHVFWISLLELY